MHGFEVRTEYLHTQWFIVSFYYLINWEPQVINNMFDIDRLSMWNGFEWTQMWVRNVCTFDSFSLSLSLTVGSWYNSNFLNMLPFLWPCNFLPSTIVNCVHSLSYSCNQYLMLRFLSFFLSPHRMFHSQLMLNLLAISNSKIHRNVIVCDRVQHPSNNEFQAKMRLETANHVRMLNVFTLSWSEEQDIHKLYV